MESDDWWQSAFWNVVRPSLLSLQLNTMALMSKAGIRTILRCAPNLEELQYPLPTTSDESVWEPGTFHDHIRRVDVWMHVVKLNGILGVNNTPEQIERRANHLLPPVDTLPAFRKLVIAPEHPIVQTNNELLWLEWKQQVSLPCLSYTIKSARRDGDITVTIFAAISYPVIPCYSSTRLVPFLKVICFPLASVYGRSISNGNSLHCCGKRTVILWSRCVCYIVTLSTECTSNRMQCAQEITDNILEKAELVGDNPVAQGKESLRKDTSDRNNSNAIGQNRNPSSNTWSQKGQHRRNVQAGRDIEEPRPCPSAIHSNRLHPTNSASTDDHGTSNITQLKVA